MDIEQKLVELIDYFVKQASSLKGPNLSPLIAEATSNPNLFAFSEILSVPSVLEYLRELYSTPEPNRFIVLPTQPTRTQ